MLDQVNAKKLKPQETEDIETTNRLAAGIKSCEKIDGLEAINEMGTELVIWHRDLPPGFNEWITELSPSCLPHLRIFVAPKDVRLALEPLFDECGLPKVGMRELLIEDIAKLVHAFSEVTGSERVDLRLEHINHDACWRFHIDNVEARLLTTYLGATTEWVHPAYAQQAINEQKFFSGPLERLAIDDVAIFKGKSAASCDGIVHRSPPIKGTGKSRLLLCLNQKSEVSPDPWDNR